MLGSGKIIMWGDWMSEETKIKISESEKGKIVNDTTRKKLSDSYSCNSCFYDFVGFYFRNCLGFLFCNGNRKHTGNSNNTGGRNCPSY